jgi:predicted Rossmann fold flavoprotein
MGLRIAVIGGGAAGFFAAINASSPSNEVVLFEKSNKVLAKVRISGGGRCNVLHHCPEPSELIKAYPRGGKSLKKPFGRFAYAQARAWFEDRGLALKIEADGRVFPVSDSSESVITVLETATKEAGVQVILQSELKSLRQKDQVFELKFRGEKVEIFDRVILALGGQPKSQGLSFLDQLQIKCVDPVPSLFTFNVPNSPLKDLLGLSVPKASVQIPGTKWRQEGPLLITHWGFSGPAVLKLSAWQALDFKARDYHFPILINWLAKGEEDARDDLFRHLDTHPAKTIGNSRYFDLPTRLWRAFLTWAGIPETKINRDLSKKERNRLLELLLRSPFEVKGKTTFKEEFVTAGGIDLSEMDLASYGVKKIPGLYAVGEMVNVDAITGGYNFQHAWTSGFIAGQDSKKGLEEIQEKG